MSHNSENIIVDQLRNGDEETFIALFRHYYVALCAYARRYVGRADIAEEIVSDTFFCMWKKHDSLEISGSVKSYLFQAVCNNSLSFLRKLKKEMKFEDYFLDSSYENIATESSVTDLPEKSLIMEEISAKIEEAIEQLPRQQQTAFKLKRFEDKKNREIAEIMGISVKTVEMHLAKAIFSLRNSLKEYLPAFLLLMYIKDIF